MRSRFAMFIPIFFFPTVVDASIKSSAKSSTFSFVLFAESTIILFQKFWSFFTISRVSRDQYLPSPGGEVAGDSSGGTDPSPTDSQLNPLVQVPLDFLDYSLCCSVIEFWLLAFSGSSYRSDSHPYQYCVYRIIHSGTQHTGLGKSYNRNGSYRRSWYGEKKISEYISGHACFTAKYITLVTFNRLKHFNIFVVFSLYHHHCHLIENICIVS